MTSNPKVEMDGHKLHLWFPPFAPAVPHFHVEAAERPVLTQRKHQGAGVKFEAQHGD